MPDSMILRLVSQAGKATGHFFLARFGCSTCQVLMLFHLVSFLATHLLDVLLGIEADINQHVTLKFRLASTRGRINIVLPTSFSSSLSSNPKLSFPFTVTKFLWLILRCVQKVVISIQSVIKISTNVLRSGGNLKANGECRHGSPILSPPSCRSGTQIQG